MYSVVLMMALSGGAESADFGHRRASDCNGCSCSGAVASCHGCSGSYSGCSGSCSGCSGTVVYSSCSCSGSSCSGCHGSSACNGCDGGGRQGLFGRLFHRNRGNDCCSAPVSCNGCTGYTGCSGCHGTAVYHGCTGCSGVVYQGCTGCTGTVVTTPPAVEKKKMPTEKVPPAAKKEKIEEVSAPATIVVNLPADAVLTVDGKATTSTSELRTFVTPNLEQGSDYVYTLRAEVVRDGRPVVETQQITVRGGQTTTVPFVFSSQGVASR